MSTLPSFAGTPAHQYSYNTLFTHLAFAGWVGVRQAPEELHRHCLFLCVKHQGGIEPSGACHGEKSH